MPSGSPDDDHHPPTDGAQPEFTAPVAPAPRPLVPAPRDDPILECTERAKWAPLTSGCNTFIRWADRRMKASAFDMCQSMFSTEYLNTTLSAIDVLFNLDHAKRDVVMAAFVREAAREDDPDVLIDTKAVAPYCQNIQKYLHWRQAATDGAAARFGDWSFKKSRALYMNLNAAVRERDKAAKATGGADAPLDGGAAVQVHDAPGGAPERGAVTIFPEHTELFRRYLRARVRLVARCVSSFCRSFFPPTLPGS